MARLKKISKTLIFVPIAIMSFTYWWGALNTMASEAKYVTHFEIIDKYRNVLTIELIMLLVGFVHFLSSLGLIFRNKLSRTIFIGATSVLLLYNIVIFVLLVFGVIRSTRAQTHNFFFQGIVYISFYILSLACLFSKTVKSLFIKENDKTSPA